MDPISTTSAGDGMASVNALLAEYGTWLDRQRGLAPITVDNYCWNVEQFLAALPGPAQVSMGLVDAGRVTAFMVEHCRDLQHELGKDNGEVVALGQSTLSAPT